MSTNFRDYQKEPLTKEELNQWAKDLILTLKCHDKLEKKFRRAPSDEILSVRFDM